jgi:glucosamine kinase
MIAIVDGGSTKCDWVILENSGKISQKTESIGFNPNIINADLIPQEIEKNPHLFLIKNQLDYIYFYGSGCGTRRKRFVCRDTIAKSFSVC